MQIKEIDNFANIQEQMEIIQYLQSEFTHGLQTTTVSGQDKNELRTKLSVDNPQFVKLIFSGGTYNETNYFIDSKFFPLVYSLLHKNKLSNYFIDRIKINTTFPYPNTTKKNYGLIHPDFTLPNRKGMSIIYYINNSDGDTVFFDNNLNEKKRISPRQGKAIVFDSDIYHAGSCPINSPYRQIINFVLYK